MERIKCATFNKEIQDSIPKEIREKMKRDRDNAEKEQETKAKTLPIQNVMASAFVVHVNQKCVVVITKTKDEVFERLRATGLEWDSISIEALDDIYPHLPTV